MKFTAVAVKVPSAAACTGVDWSIEAATLAPPQLLLGLLTSLRAIFPLTPRAGLTPACAWAPSVNARTRAEEAKTLEKNMVGSLSELKLAKKRR